jgi:heme/copper-type cytochrome/quinol oxidase subunit 4
MTHNGIDIDQYVLFTIYPFAAFMVSGLVARKTKMAEVTKYVIQAAICIAFSIVYFVAVPNGGAQGLAIVLAMFSAILLLMARKHKVHPEPEEDQQSSTRA